MRPRLPLLGSAALRVTLGVAAGIILLSVGAMAVQYRITASALEDRQGELMAAELAGFAQFYEQRRIPGLREAIEARATVTGPDEALYLLQDRNGQRLAGNIASWPEGVVPSGSLFAAAPMVEVPGPAGAYRGVARELPGGFPLLAARAMTPVTETLRELRGTILRVAAGLSALALLAGWLVARAVVGRIGRLNALADRVAGGELSARLPGPRTRDEFGALETHFHAMLDRIEALNRATHRLSDTIAHELRTPLNRIRQRLGRIEGQADEIAALQAEIAGTVRIFDSLLDISSAEAASGQRPGLVPVDFSTLAAEVFDLYAPLAEDRGLQAAARIAPDCWVLGERNLLAQLVSNLLDNAIKFTAPGDRVELTLAPEADRHLLVVSDTGPGLPEELRGEAFDRFTRADRDRDRQGHGLGLALVQAIAARHGARPTLPPVRRGFRIEIAWPKLSRP
ncbi:HAMP domain-containing protein [Pseudooceanicola sp. 216_PA32_1]|uniref:histidine kinase n=1 Tax=Pseudooceanicola pacificus TaxID=2676438 RepID=A0A844W4G1_9RHOB|nr:HAMP domain-containing sensor histidine kinase [Pseudooceanicola pacificus]MWB77691.1 HAMP domain-containing protein [Pseudooceanicola pacificus]